MHSAVPVSAGRAAHDELPAAVHASLQLCPPPPSTQVAPELPQLELTDS